MVSPFLRACHAVGSMAMTTMLSSVVEVPGQWVSPTLIVVLVLVVVLAIINDL